MDSLLVILSVLVLRPYVAEAFKVPTNSMAPTILGQHWEAPCPRCGGPAYATPEQGFFGRPVLMICGTDHRSCEIADPPRIRHSCDRFLVNKLTEPQRWDVVVFHSPEDPDVLFCKRLVGLPGEMVTIRNGAVWIDGKKQTPPESCKGIEYLDHIEGWPGTLWGSDAKPACLGADEYFVLGDFSARAKDSRLWQRGAPGHPPYALPKSHVIGVAECIYWPLNRCAWVR